jgi:DNA replication protein DnaC
MSLMEAFDNAVNQSIINNPKEDGDYIGENGLLYCGKCNTPKQTKVEVPSLGIVRYPHCSCKCRAEELDSEEDKRKEEERQRRIADKRRMAFPKEEREKMQQWTFANDDMQNKRITQAMQNYVDNFPEMKKKGKGLLLYGVCGTGKTFAACEVANALIDNGYSVLVTNFARILNTLQGSYDKQEYIDRLNSYSLLVVDDLGIERGTEYAKEQVFNIIDSRYRAGLPMIITTNLTMEDIKNPDTIMDKRIYERILEKCHPIEVKGDNRRRKTIRNEYDDMQNLLGL